MITLEGIPVSPGVVIGRVFVMDDQRRRIARRTTPPEAVGAELERLEAALNQSREGLSRVYERAQREMGAEAAKIFRFHQGMLSDEALIEPIRSRIRDEHVAAEYAVYSVFAELAQQFRSMTDSVFTTKVNDIHDLSNRILRALIGEHASRLSGLDHQAVIIAGDLTPSQTARFDRTKVIGFATDLGGKTSHTAIMARALRIPAVVGVGEATLAAADGMPVIIDGDRGLVVLDPTPEKTDEYEAYIEQARVRQLSLAELSSLPSVTRDGVEIQLLGNIEFPEEASDIIEAGGQGVGLYRTEFLYLTSQTEPSEEDHFNAYRTCIERLGGRDLTIRTVDLGADKYTQEQADVPERNPFLGCRSIRYCLTSLPMFKRQIRAILRASALGPVRMMFPLITSPSEFRHAKMIVRDVMEDLAEDRVEYDRSIPIGMMVEVPSAALMAETFAREVDFFSIGTNDLVQYTLAVDRTNERVAHLFNPAHPAVTKLIKDVVRASRRHDVPVSCCGEAAGEVEHAMLLIGLGLRRLSVAASSIPRIKRLIRSVTIKQCERIARKAASFDSDVQVSAYLRDRARVLIPEAIGGRTVENPEPTERRRA